MMRRRRLETVGRVALLWGAILSLAAGIGGWVAPPSVEAASVKSLQSGVATSVPTTGTVVTLSPSIDATKAFVVCSARTSTGYSHQRATCVLTNTTLTIDVGSRSSNTVSVSWYVVEFEGGVTVQRNTASFAGGTTTVAVTLSPAVDCTKSFVALAGEQTNATGGTSTATDNDEVFTFRAILGTAGSPCTSGTTGTLTLLRTDSGIAATVAWQVVTYDGASVQRGTATIAINATTATATLGTAVDTSKSFILMSRSGGTAIAGIEGQYQTTARFTTTGPSVTGLTFTRAAQNNTANRQVDISWQVVALSDGSTVQTGTTTSAGTTATMSTTGLPSMDLTRTVPFFTASGGSATSDTRLDETSWTVVLTNTSIAFTRGVSSAIVSSADWFAVSFNKCGAVSDVTNVSASAQSGQATVYWQPSATVLIGRKLTTGFGVNDAPVNGKSYLVSEAIGAGTVVDNQAGATSSFSQTGLDASGTTYYFYKVFRKNVTGPCYAPGNEFITQRDVTPMGGVGSPNWSYAMSASSLAPPGLDPNGVVIAGSNDSFVHGMNASDGAQRFPPYDTGNGIQSRPPVIPPTYSTLGLTVAYVTSQDGTAYAIETVGGLLAWQSAVLGGQLQGGAAVWLQAVKTLTWTFGPQPDMVVVGTRNMGAGERTNNKVYGVHGENGTADRTFNPGNMDFIVSTPSIDYGGQTIWVTSYSNGGAQPSLWKLNALTVTLMTSFSLGDISGSPSGSLDGTLTTPSSFVYVGTDAGELKAVRVSDNTIFTYTPGGTGAIKGAPLSVSFDPPSATTPDTIIFSRDTTVHSVSFDGSSFSPNWTATLPGTPTVSAPIDDFIGTAVYVGASNGKLYSLDYNNGAVMGERTVPSPSTPVVGTPSFDIDLNRVYVGATDGHFYSFDAF